MHHKILYTSLLYLICLQLAFAQSPAAALPLYGVPGITHFNRADFNADPQFWTVCEDQSGVLYFGNNDGAVIFDGERWFKVFLPNNSAVRSLASDASGNIWAGGYNELGQIKKDPAGRYYYVSLLDSLDLQNKNLENLWQVHAIKGSVVFRSFTKLLVITGNKVAELPAHTSFQRSFLVHDRLYVLDKEQGIQLIDLQKMQLETVFPPESFQAEYLVSLLPTDSSAQLLAIAQSGKIFMLDVQHRSGQLWKSLFLTSGNDQLINAIRATDGLYYIGTLSSRIISMNARGEVFSDEHAFERIQDKTVLNLYQTSTGNLWALLNNGLDLIDFSSPVSTLFENASIYDILIHESTLYLATNQGVFAATLALNELPRSRLQFEKVKGLEGQAWSLQLVAGDVLVGHDRGLFTLKEGKGTPVGGLEGIWKVIPLSDRPGAYLACSYKGLYLIEKDQQGRWQVRQRISGFDESSRDILAADTPGTYWVCHGYKGVYRIKLSTDFSRVTSVEHFTTQNGLPSPFNVNVVRWQGATVFTTNQGVYSFDARRNQFVPFAPLNTILDSSKNTRKLLQHEDQTWFVQDDEAGFFHTSEGKASIQKELFLKFKGTFNRGMESLLPLDNQRVLFGTNMGLYLVRYANAGKQQEVPTYINSVRYTLNQKEHWLPLASSKTAASELPHNTSMLRFEFAAPAMQNSLAVQYSYRLEPIDNSWSAWKEASSVEYNHLPPGRYTFRVRSRNLLGTTGHERAYTFEVLPIWYQTAWAWAVYFVLAALSMALMVYLISRKLMQENTKARQEEQKARKLLELELAQMKLHNEKERMRLEKEQLEEDVIYKSKELANYTMLLVKKREAFSELLQDLKVLREQAKNEGSREKVRTISKKISQHLASEEHLQVFDTNFEKIHHHFFSTLRQLYPELNQRELRLCAFVKMDLSNKEISPLLNISVRGVETARYRIRKKLNLEHEHNLVEFLEKLSPTEEKHAPATEEIVLQGDK